MWMLFVGHAGDHDSSRPPGGPFGLVKIGPDTAGGRHNRYVLRQPTLKGFSHTRVGGVGCGGGGGSVRIKPAFGKSLRDTLDKASEKAGPGWYHVALANGIVADLTASTRVGFHRYAFPAKQEPVCIHIDPSKSYAGIVDSAWSVRDKTLITGFVKAKNVCGHGYYNLFYAIRFDKPFAKAEPDDKGAWCTFKKRLLPRHRYSA